MSENVPLTGLPLDPDILKDLVHAAVVECEHKMMELQTQHTKMQQRALCALVDGVGKAYAERLRAHDSNREDTSPTTANGGPLSTTASSAGSYSSEWVVESQLMPHGARFHTMEPPSMESTFDSRVPKLDMAVVIQELTGELTPDGRVAQAQARRSMTPSLTLSSSTDSDSCDLAQFDPDDKFDDEKHDEKLGATHKLCIPTHDEDPLEKVWIPMPMGCKPPLEEPSAFHEHAARPLKMVHVCTCGWAYEDNAKFCSKCGATRKHACWERIADADPSEMDEPRPMGPQVGAPVGSMLSAHAKTPKASKAVAGGSRKSAQAGAMKVASKGEHPQKPCLKDAQHPDVKSQKPIVKDVQRQAMNLPVKAHPSTPVKQLALEVAADTPCSAPVGVVKWPTSLELRQQPDTTQKVNWGFEAAVGLLIIMSATIVGVEASNVLAGRVVALVRAAQILILLGFVWELSVRIRALGTARAALRSPLIMLDLFAIFGGWLYVIMQLFLGGASFRTLCVVQLLRLARLPRITWRFIRLASSRVHVAPVGEQLQLEGFLCGILPVVLAATVACAGFLYVWAVLGVHLIQSEADFGEDYKATAEAHFGSLGRSILTLVSAFTLDGISSIYTPLVVARPALALYFGVLILLGSFISLGVLLWAVAEVLAWGTPQGRTDTDAKQVEQMTGLAQLRDLKEYIDMSDRLEAIEDSVRDLVVRLLAYPALLGLPQPQPEQLEPLEPLEPREPESPQETLEI